jgi:hypothetical protein
VDFGERSPSGGGTGRDRLGRLIIGRLLGFEGTRAGGWDPSASALLATRRHQGERASSVRGAPAACVAPLRHGGEDREGKGERWG